MAIHQFSKGAYERMQREFEDLSTRGRFAVAEKIERAREMGDLKENGDYHAAKDEQGHMEGRIRQLEYLLANGEVIQAVPHGEVYVGQKITLVYEGDSDSDAETYIIGHVEEKLDGYDIVSPGSPLGAALLGAEVGAWVSYEAPTGALKVKVLAAEPAET